jgi:hypothetical protein
MRASGQSRVFDWKKALEGLRTDEKLKALPYFPEGGKGPGRGHNKGQHREDEGIREDTCCLPNFEGLRVFEFVSIRKKDLYATDGHLF